MFQKVFLINVLFINSFIVKLLAQTVKNTNRAVNTTLNYNSKYDQLIDQKLSNLFKNVTSIYHRYQISIFFKMAFILYIAVIS
jgi:hypothetical protein